MGSKHWERVERWIVAIAVLGSIAIGLGVLGFWGDEVAVERMNLANAEARDFRAEAERLTRANGGKIVERGLVEGERGSARWEVALHRDSVSPLRDHLSSSDLLEGHLVYDTQVVSDYPMGLVSFRRSTMAADIMEKGREAAWEKRRVAVGAVMAYLVVCLIAWICAMSAADRKEQREYAST